MTRYSTLLALCVLLAACSSGAQETQPPRPAVETTTTTSTTLPPTTTTTTVPDLSVAIKGAPPRLERAIEIFYSYATGASKKKPKAPAVVLAGVKVEDVEVPARGKASLGKFHKQKVAVVEVGRDVFLAVDGRKGWQIVGGRWPTLSIPRFFGRSPRHVAVVGSDARPGQDVDRSRADSIHFVALDSRRGGAVVGLPRDSWVPIPGYGTGKITTSLSLGGPDTMMTAFDELTGLPLDGYMITGFSGFESLLGSVLGGVELDVPFAINDRWAHVDLGAGEQVLDGAEALGFARARKTVPNGDFTRSEHQGMILLSAASAVKAMGLRAIPELMELSEPYIQTDLSAGELLTFSAQAISADLDKVSNVVAPGSPGWAGSASVVYLASSVDELWKDLADGRLDE